MKKKLLTALAIGTFTLSSAGMASAAYFADVAFVIDQSGSMGGEFNWLANSITSIDSALTGAGITTNYGVAGYETLAGTADSRNVWSDIGSITDTINAVSGASVYGGRENGYDAADWAITGFDWTGGDYAKVMVLITDEPGQQYSTIGESDLGQKLDDAGILLNVITFSNLFSGWDDAVYDINDPAYSGLFDLNYLRTDAAGFTADFTAAKLTEIQQHNPVPEPGMMLLMGTGLAGLIGIRRKRMNKK